jgi:hypothetical protein
MMTKARQFCGDSIGDSDFEDEHAIDRSERIGDKVSTGRHSVRLQASGFRLQASSLKDQFTVV